MQKKIIKIVAIVAGVILAWALIFMIFGEARNQGPKTEIEFWNVFDTTETMDPLFSKFKEETGVQVNYRNFTDLDEYRDTLLLELAAGGGPDVLAVHAGWIEKYQNLLLPLPEKMGYSADDVDEDFVDAVVAAGIIEDQVFALPMYIDTLALFYNKTFFRNILSKPYPAPELTWDGIREDVIQLTSRDEDGSPNINLSGIALGRADNITRGVDLFYSLYHQFGGKNLAESSSEKSLGNPEYGNRPVLAALNFLTSFSRSFRHKEYSWNFALGSGYPEKEITAFTRGDVAMIAGFSYYLDSIRALTKQRSSSVEFSEIGVAPFPQIADPRMGNPKKALAEFFALSVAKSSEHPIESWQLILELTSKTSQEKYFEATKKPTSRRDLIDDQKEDEQFGIFAEQAVFADTLSIADDRTFNAAIADVLDRISDGEITPSEGAKELEKVFSEK